MTSCTPLLKAMAGFLWPAIVQITLYVSYYYDPIPPCNAPTILPKSSLYLALRSDTTLLANSSSKSSGCACFKIFIAYSSKSFSLVISFSEISTAETSTSSGSPRSTISSSISSALSSAIASNSKSLGSPFMFHFIFNTIS